MSRKENIQAVLSDMNRQRSDLCGHCGEEAEWIGGHVGNCSHCGVEVVACSDCGVCFGDDAEGYCGDCIHGSRYREAKGL